MRKTFAAFVAAVLIAGTFPTATLAVTLPQVPHGGNGTDHSSAPVLLPKVKKQARPLSLSGRAANSPAAADALALAPGQKGLFVVQFNAPITDNSRSTLQAVGADLGPYLGGPALIARMTPEAAAKLAKDESVASVERYRPEWKVSADLKQGKGAANVRVVTFPAAGRATASGLQAMGAKPTMAGTNQFVLTQADAKQVSQVANLEEVLLVEEAKQPELFNDVARGIMNVSGGTGAPWTNGLKGQGQIIGIADTGLDTGSLATLHPDLKNRIAGTSAWGRSGDWSDPHGHGTHVAGSAVGDGTTSAGKYAGAAPGAKVYFQSILTADFGLNIPNEDVSVLLDEAYQKGARIHSDSWGASYEGGHAPYDSWAAQLDTYTWSHRDFTVLFAAGNDGTEGEVTANGYWTISTPANAKNGITIGATENVRPELPQNYRSMADNANDLAWFSSKGPTNDGRIKPDLVAPGTWILSTKSALASDGEFWAVQDVNYAYMGGTSMATPLSAGAAAIVRQYYTEKKNIASPSSALIKATLINGAQDTGWGWGSPEQGWGRIDLKNSLYPSARTTLFKDEADPIAFNDTHEYAITVESGDIFKATLVWNDYPAMPNASYALINDLDLFVEAPDGTWYAGNCFNAAGDDMLTVDDANCYGDAVNNVENVYLKAPVAGTYHVYVNGYDVPSGSQPYALVISGKSDTVAPNLTVNGLSDGYRTGTVTVTADATDDGVGMDRVEYLVNGQKRFSSSVSPYTWTWDTTKLSGAQTVTVKAYDRNNNVATQTFQVTIDNLPPVITSMSPRDGALVRGNVPLIVNVSDNIQIDRVEFFLDDAAQPAHTAAAAPWTFAWETTEADNGPHTVKVIVYDKAGLTDTETINVKVDSTAPTISLPDVPEVGAKLRPGFVVAPVVADNLAVAKVEFLLDGKVKLTDTKAPYEYTLPSLTDSHELLVRATDTAGNVTELLRSISVDGKAPTGVSMTGIASGKTYADTVSITVTATDNLEFGRVEFWLDKENRTELFTEPQAQAAGFLAVSITDDWTRNFDTTKVDDGSHSLQAVVYDAHGNATKSAMVNFKVDNFAPVVAGITPADGAIKGKTAVTAQVSDSGGISYVEFYLNGAETPTYTDKSAPYSVTVDTTKMPDGQPMTVKVKAYDPAGHTAEKSYDLKVDNTAPEVMLPTTEGKTVKAELVSITASTSDNDAVKYVEFYVGSKKQATVPVENGAATWEWNTAGVRSGSYTLTAKAYDMAGNVTTSDPMKVTVDSLAPTVTFATPAAGAIVTGTVDVKVTVSDNNKQIAKVEYWLDGLLQSEVPLVGKYYVWQWDTTQAEPGVHTVTVKASDPAGNVAEVQRDLKIDLSAPSVPTFANLTENQFVKSGYRVAIDALDTIDDTGIVKAEYYVDGKKLGTVTKGDFSWAISSTVKAGPHTIKVVVYDGAGNQTESASLPFVLDRTAPKLSVSGLGTTAKGSVTVTATATDENVISKVEIYVGSEMVASYGGPAVEWVWDTTALSNGYQTVKVVAYDTAGNTTTYTKRVKVAN